MKTKILEALKQAYSHLGLGEEFLTAQASSLAESGLVTEENLANVVASQKGALEMVQRTNDRRVADAQRKLQEEQTRVTAELRRQREEGEQRIREEYNRSDQELRRKLEDAQLQIDEMKKRQDTQDPDSAPLKNETDNGDAYPAWFQKILTQRQEEMDSIRKQMTDLSTANTALRESLSAIQKEKVANEKARIAQQRQTFITNKAKELGIPQWRIDQGFTFTDSMSETEISDTLSGYANDIKMNLLPSRTQALPVDMQAVSPESAAEIARAMVR